MLDLVEVPLMDMSHGKLDLDLSLRFYLTKDIKNPRCTQPHGAPRTPTQHKIIVIRNKTS